MRWFYELSWLWEALGIALAITAACVVCAVLICRAAKVKFTWKLAVLIGAAAFVTVILIIIFIARTPMPL